MSSKSDAKVIFPNPEEDGGNVSVDFETNASITLLQFANLQEGDFAIIETYTGDDCDNKWIPFNISCCGQVRIDFPTNHLLLPLPLRYRVVLLNEDDSHLNDPTHFEEAEIYKTNIKAHHSLEPMYNNCCNDSIKVCQNSDE